MPAFIIYILKFSISLGLVYLFYRLMLRRLTFYNYNRWYLLGYSLLCFIIPFINISSFIKTDQPGNHSLVRYIPSLETYAGNTQNDVQNIAVYSSTPWDKWDWILLIIAS